MKKRLLQVGGVIAVVTLVCGVGLLYYIDRVARWAVEGGASYALGVPTALAGMDIGITSGQVQLAGLAVANPPGFTSKQFLSLGEGRVAVSLGSLLGDTVEMPELTLRDIDLSLERRGGQANYRPILDNLSKLGSSEAPAEEAGGGKKFVIRHVVIQDVTVDAQLSSIGGELTRVPVTIERIELTDLGTDSDKGVLLSELIGIVTKAILTAVVRKAGNFLPEDISGELGEGLARLGKLGGATVHVVGEVTALVGGEIKQLGDRGRELVGGIGEAGAGLIQGSGEAREDLRDAAGKMKDEARGQCRF